jgi:hypothetical protein
MKSQLVTSYTLKQLLLNCNIMLNNNKIGGIYILTNPVIYK